MEKAFIEAVRNVRSNAQSNAESTDASTENAESQEIKASKRESYDFEKCIDSWDGVTEGFSFTMGETPMCISDLEVDGHKIGKRQVKIDASKVKKIMQDHKEMTRDIIKQLPILLGNPILILDSKTVEGSLVLFGEVYANGVPVMMSLELNPTTRSGRSTYIDIVKVSSAYTRSNTQNIINTSNIRYKNENRVNDWLKVNRLQLPLPNSQSDSATISISENSEKSKDFDQNSSKKSSKRENDETYTTEELANAFESIAKTKHEKSIVRQYKDNIGKRKELIDQQFALIQERSTLRGQKGSEAAAKRSELTAKIKNLSERISRYDLQLLLDINVPE